MAVDYVGDAVDELIRNVSGDDDEMGYSVEGDDDEMGYQEVGRRARKAKHRKRMLAALGSPVLSRSARDINKRAPLGLGAFSLATTLSTTLSATVQRAFQPDRLLVTSSAIGLLITSIKVGDEEQVLNGSVPAELYGTSALTDSQPDDFSAGATAISFSVSLNNPTGGTITGAVGFKGLVKR